jgi:hypothetical protein
MTTNNSTKLNKLQKAFDRWDRQRHYIDYKHLKQYTDAYCKKAGMKQGSIIRDGLNYDIEVRADAFEAGWKAYKRLLFNE